jgi:hypothetical protein
MHINRASNLVRLAERRRSASIPAVRSKRRAPHKRTQTDSIEEENAAEYLRQLLHSLGRQSAATILLG